MSLVITQKPVPWLWSGHSNPPPDSLTLAAPEALVFFGLSQIQRSREWGSGRILLVLYQLPAYSPREDQGAWNKLLWVWRGSMNLKTCVGEKLSSYLSPRTSAASLPAHLACKNTVGTPVFCPSGTGFQWVQPLVWISWSHFKGLQNHLSARVCSEWILLISLSSAYDKSWWFKCKTLEASVSAFSLGIWEEKKKVFLLKRNTSPIHKLEQRAKGTFFVWGSS